MRSLVDASQYAPGRAQWSAGSIDDDGIRNGFATSASNASTHPTATPIVSSQSTTVRHGPGRRPVVRSRMPITPSHRRAASADNGAVTDDPKVRALASAPLFDGLA